MDFWAGTFGPPFLAFVEVIIMMWLFGGDKLWEEMHRGAALRVPRIFYYAAKYVTPAFLGIILVTWAYQNIAMPFFTGSLSETAVEGVPIGWAVWVTRIFLLSVFAVLCILVYLVWRRRAEEL